MESRKMVLMNLFAGQQWRSRHRTDLQTWQGEEREGETYGESNMETSITICKTDSQWEFAVWLRKLQPGLWDNLEGWEEVRGGREVQKDGTYVYLWLIHVDIWQETT